LAHFSTRLKTAKYGCLCVPELVSKSKSQKLRRFRFWNGICAFMNYLSNYGSWLFTVGMNHTDGIICILLNYVSWVFNFCINDTEVLCLFISSRTLLAVLLSEPMVHKRKSRERKTCGLLFGGKVADGCGLNCGRCWGDTRKFACVERGAVAPVDNRLRVPFATARTARGNWISDKAEWHR
jgi:hypothetical protein